MLLAERVKPSLLEALRAKRELSEDARLALTILASWDDKASRDSRGALLFTGLGQLSGAIRQPFAIPWDPARPAVTPSGRADPEAAVGRVPFTEAEIRANVEREYRPGRAPRGRTREQPRRRPS